MEDKGYSPPNVDHLDAWHILEMSQSGRPVEQVAQFIASWFTSGDLAVEEMRSEVTKVAERIAFLMLHPEEIWDGLLPGGHTTPLCDMFCVVGTEVYGKMANDVITLSKIREVFAANPTGLGDQRAWNIVNEVSDLLNGEPEVDPNEYVYSIVINPSVRHDELSDLVKDASKEYVTSPMNLAKAIYKDIDTLDKMGRWPAEELAAWITNVKDDTHWMMTWDQAVAIVKLEETQEALERVDFDGIDWDGDIWQGIQDQMAMAGQEYINTKS